MLLYLDCCCLNRPFDDRSQERVRIEVSALEIIMERVKLGDWTLIGSDALVFELSRIRKPAHREAVLDILAEARVWVEESLESDALAQVLRDLGIPGMDASHLACATLGGADVLLTVDMRLYKRANRLQYPSIVRVELPAAWLERQGQENTE